MNEKLLEYFPDPNVVKGNVAEIFETLQLQAPELVNEILAWSVWYHATYQLCALISAICLVYTLKKYVYPFSIKYSSDSDGFSWLVTAANVGFIIACAVVFAMNFGWIKAVIAPKLFVIEYISELF